MIYDTYDVVLTTCVAKIDVLSSRSMCCGGKSYCLRNRNRVRSRDSLEPITTICATESADQKKKIENYGIAAVRCSRNPRPYRIRGQISCYTYFLFDEFRNRPKSRDNSSILRIKNKKSDRSFRDRSVCSETYRKKCFDFSDSQRSSFRGSRI